MLEEGLASAQQQPVGPAGASAAPAAQAEAAGKAASTKELRPANQIEGASSHLTERPAAGMSKNQMKKLAKQQRSVHSKHGWPLSLTCTALAEALPDRAPALLRHVGAFVCAAAAPEAGHVRLQRLQLQSVSISYQA